VAGSYAISQDELIQHKATSGEISLDAESLDIPAGKLIPTLQELFGLEKEYALRKAAVLRRYWFGPGDTIYVETIGSDGKRYGFEEEKG
jgi:hypothetical protein